MAYLTRIGYKNARSNASLKMRLPRPKTRKKRTFTRLARRLVIVYQRLRLLSHLIRGLPFGEYRSRMDLTLAASLIRNDVKIALFNLLYPTELGDLFGLILVLTSSSVLGSLALTTAWKDMTEKTPIRDSVCLVVLGTLARRLWGLGRSPP